MSPREFERRAKHKLAVLQSGTARIVSILSSPNASSNGKVTTTTIDPTVRISDQMPFGSAEAGSAPSICSTPVCPSSPWPSLQAR